MACRFNPSTTAESVKDGVGCGLGSLADDGVGASGGAFPGGPAADRVSGSVGAGVGGAADLVARDLDGNTPSGSRGCAWRVDGRRVVWLFSGIGCSAVSCCSSVAVMAPSSR